VFGTQSHSDADLFRAAGNHVRPDSIQPNGSKYKGQEAVQQSETRDEAFAGEIEINLFAETHHAKYSQVRIDTVNGSPNKKIKVVQMASDVQFDVIDESGRLQQWEEEHWLHWFRRVEVLCILHHANDFEIAAMTRVSHAEAFPYGIVIREKVSRESIINDCNLRGTSSVARREAAPAQNVRPNRLKILSTDLIP